MVVAGVEREAVLAPGAGRGRGEPHRDAPRAQEVGLEEDPRREREPIGEALRLGLGVQREAEAPAAKPWLEAERERLDHLGGELAETDLPARGIDRVPATRDEAHAADPGHRTDQQHRDQPPERHALGGG
ncbi:MAG: hypothetical protein IPK07_14950 [Deltaproteobacteria bacterium]|nr:hypothetical protein [Deltaproteobacteria bacterium]